MVLPAALTSEYATRAAIFLVLALMITWWVSSFAEPVVVNPSLPLNGGVQTGWPLPYSSLQWVEVTPGKGGYNQAVWNGTSLAVDVLLFYVALNLIAFAVRCFDTTNGGTLGNRARQNWPGVLSGLLYGLVIVLIIALVITLSHFVSPTESADELPTIVG